MLNMIRAEIYKTTKRSYSKIFLLACSALVIAFVILMRATIPQQYMDTGRKEVIGFFIYLMMIPFFLTVITSDIVFSEEGKHNTMKNAVSFGYTRTQIYFSKLVVSLINFVAMALLVLAVSIVSVIVLFPNGDYWQVSLNMYLWSFLVSMPLWLSQAALCIAIWCNIKSSTAGTFVSLFIGYMLPMGLQMMYLITDEENYYKAAMLFPASRLTEPTEVSVLSYTINEFGAEVTEVFSDYGWFVNLLKDNCIVGFGFLAVVTVAGWLCFRKREIK